MAGAGHEFWAVVKWRGKVAAIKASGLGFSGIGGDRWGKKVEAVLEVGVAPKCDRWGQKSPAAAGNFEPTIS